MFSQSIMEKVMKVHGELTWKSALRVRRINKPRCRWFRVASSKDERGLARDSASGGSKSGPAKASVRVNHAVDSSVGNRR